eukprot:SAG31_NODE_7063_length_1799_cov_1.926471_1_plen_277_part_10
MKRERTNLEEYWPAEQVAKHKEAQRAEEKRLAALHPVARRLEVQAKPEIGYLCPGSGRVIVQLKQPPPTNLFKSTPAGEFWSSGSPLTRRYCRILISTARRCKAADDTEAAVKCLQEYVELDSTDSLDGRVALVQGLLDMNEPARARALLESHAVDERCGMAYSRALLEFVSWKLLGEPGSTAATAAMARDRALKSNPFAAIYLANADVFSRHVDPAEVDGADNDDALFESGAAVGYAVWDAPAGRQGMRKPSMPGKPLRRGDAAAGTGVRGSNPGT